MRHFFWWFDFCIYSVVNLLVKNYICGFLILFFNNLRILIFVFFVLYNIFFFGHCRIFRFNWALLYYIIIIEFKAIFEFSIFVYSNSSVWWSSCYHFQIWMHSYALYEFFVSFKILYFTEFSISDLPQNCWAIERCRT